MNKKVTKVVAYILIFGLLLSIFQYFTLFCERLI